MDRYKPGDKFIIELAEELYPANCNVFCDDSKLFRIKGFRSLVFDEYGLDKLERYEPDSLITPEVRAACEQKIGEITDKMKELEEMRNRLCDLIRKPDDLPF